MKDLKIPIREVFGLLKVGCWVDRVSPAARREGCL